MKSSKRRGEDLIAQGCVTYSKRLDQFVEGVYPVYTTGHDIITETGDDTPEGVSFYANGKPYVDFMGGLGANLNGWQNSYSLPSRFEPELAYRLNKIFPVMERMKFLKTGSDACEAAVRIARSVRPGMVYGLGYHGWHNIFISAEHPGTGTKQEGYVKRETLEQLIDDVQGAGEGISAVIIEPVMLDLSIKDKLKELRKITWRKGACLIFDEIVTGFRVPKYSISNWWGIKPDILCVGKALGNGYPIAVVGGSRKYMDTPGYFISNTHNGEESALRASLETLDFLTPAKLESLWARGIWFKDELNNLLEEIGVELYGLPTRATWKGDELNKALFWQEMLKRGRFFGKAFFLNFQHTKPLLEKALVAARKVVREIRDSKVKLEGKMPTEIFRRF